MRKDRPAWLRLHGRPWIDHGGTVVFDNPWIRLSRHTATAPTGAAAQYGKVHFKNVAIAVLPLHEDGTVTVVGQHRFPLGDYQWEIPEGGGRTRRTPSTPPSASCGRRPEWRRPSGARSCACSCPIR